MRNLLLALVIFVLSVPSAKSCDHIVSLSVALMESRQSGVSLVDILAIEGTGELFVFIAKDAYRQVKFNSESLQRQAVIDFTDKWYLACLDEKSDRKEEDE